MTTVIYDGSFDGLLTAIFEVYEYKLKDAEIVANHRYEQENIFAELHTTITSPEKSERILKHLEKSIGKQGIHQLMMVYLSEKADLERLILSAVRQSVEQKEKNFLENFGDPDILEIAKTVKSVGRESHRMKAFVRFEKLEDETFYAKIEPDFNVLPLIISHFKERYKDQKWMIFDLRRNYGVIWDLSDMHQFSPDSGQLQQLEKPDLFFHEEEKAYQRMWQQYFIKTGIRERKNMKLHIQWMPKRYWKYLTEKKWI